MIALMWNTSAAIRRFLCSYMPSNIAITALRTRRGLKWAMLTAVLVAPGYVFLAAMASSAITAGAPSWLYVVVLLFVWNACKFACLVPATLLSALNLVGCAMWLPRNDGRLG